MTVFFSFLGVLVILGGFGVVGRVLWAFVSPPGPLPVSRYVSQQTVVEDVALVGYGILVVIYTAVFGGIFVWVIS